MLREHNDTTSNEMVEIFFSTMMEFLCIKCAIWSDTNLMSIPSGYLRILKEWMVPFVRKKLIWVSSDHNISVTLTTIDWISIYSYFDAIDAMKNRMV